MAEDTTTPTDAEATDSGSDGTNPAEPVLEDPINEDLSEATNDDEAADMTDPEPADSSD